MTTTVKIRFSTGQVGVMSLPDGVDDFYIQAAIDKATVSWGRPGMLESAWLPVLGWERVQQSDFPADRTFRNAWRHSGSGVVIDMPEARKICAEKMKKPINDPAIVAASIPEELKVLIEAVKK